ncbi:MULTISPECIES: hypothetical protein [Rhodococcus]|jgi:hypothetical protein|uniref:Uncharacterized protein n=1 Tax=Rhodococcus opacus TaxID=37919 RepID=A0A076EYQ0_RHOOP|nr:MULTISPECIES: hypothetical protein [Rhodococcus]AII08459.1 hypothetical protein EP51_29120 [Rhodococcus opacus]EJI99015.1 hypothetical protein JVH1_3447 [Rhodococcus sp. JVH1]MDH6288415.1 hypothetical protein [Rhodococcus opacus]WAM12680.1 hypothetical protein OYT95_24955 [Rhodococcus sp. JS3073]
MDYTTNTAIAAVKALTEVVTPVVDASGDAQAIEQVRLVTDFVRFVEGRAHWIGDRQRGQLREQVALGNEIRTDIGSLPSWSSFERALGTAARVSEDAGATGEQQRRATEELSSAISRALRETDELDAATRRRIERAVVAASLHRADVDRAWLLPLGFDPEPSSVRSLQAVFTP